jgi:hypothetical protein
VARAFRRKGDRFVAKFDEMERGVVAGLMEQTREIVVPPDVADRPQTGDAFDDLVAGLGVSVAGEDQESGPTRSVDRDPALERLLPTAHRGDEQVAAEFRRLTEHGLRDRKATNLATAIAALRDATGDRLELTREQAEAVLVALTDTRLVLGERLGLRTDEDALALDERISVPRPGQSRRLRRLVLRLPHVDAGVADDGAARPRAVRLNRCWSNPTSCADAGPRRASASTGTPAPSRPRTFRKAPEPTTGSSAAGTSRAGS